MPDESRSPEASASATASSGFSGLKPASSASVVVPVSSAWAPRRAIRWVGVAVVVIGAIAAGAYFWAHRPPKLTAKDSIVLADFTNTTGDSVL